MLTAAKSDVRQGDTSDTEERPPSSLPSAPSCTELSDRERSDIQQGGTERSGTEMASTNITNEQLEHVESPPQPAIPSQIHRFDVRDAPHLVPSSVPPRGYVYSFVSNGLGRWQRLRQLWRQYGRNMCGQGAVLLGLLLCTQLLLSWASIGWQLHHSWQPLTGLMQWTVTLPTSSASEVTMSRLLTTASTDSMASSVRTSVTPAPTTVSEPVVDRNWPPSDIQLTAHAQPRDISALSLPPVLLSERTAWINMLTDTMPLTGNIALATQPWFLGATRQASGSRTPQAYPLRQVDVRLLPKVKIKPKPIGRVVSSIIIDPALLELIKGDDVSSKSVVAEPPPLPPPPQVYYPLRLPVQYVSQGYFSLVGAKLWGEPPLRYAVVVNTTAAQRLGCRVATDCVGRFIRVADHLMPNVFAGQQLRIGGVVHDVPHHGVFQRKQPMLYVDVRFSPPWQTLYVLAKHAQQAVVEMRLDKLQAGHWRFMQQQRFDIAPTDMRGFYLPLSTPSQRLLPLPPLDAKPWPLQRSLTSLLSIEWLTLGLVLGLAIVALGWLWLLRVWWQLLRAWYAMRSAEARLLDLLTAFDEKYRPVVAVNLVKPTRTRIRKRNINKPPPTAPRHFAAITAWLFRRHGAAAMALFLPCLVLVAAMFAELAPLFRGASHALWAVYLQDFDVTLPLLMLVAVLALLLPFGFALRLTLVQLRQTVWQAPVEEPKVSKTKSVSLKNHDVVASLGRGHARKLAAANGLGSSGRSASDDDELLFKRRVKKVVAPVSPFQILAPQAWWELRLVTFMKWLESFSLRQVCSYGRWIPEPRKV